MNQKQRVLEWCQLHDSITTRDAILELGIADLQGVIRDLKQQGHTILDMWEKGVNRYGESVPYKRYFVEVE